MHLHAGKTIRMQLQFPKDIGFVKKMLLNIKKKHYMIFIIPKFVLRTSRRNILEVLCYYQNIVIFA